MFPIHPRHSLLPPSPSPSQDPENKEGAPIPPFTPASTVTSYAPYHKALSTPKIVPKLTKAQTSVQHMIHVTFSETFVSLRQGKTTLIKCNSYATSGRKDCLKWTTYSFGCVSSIIFLVSPPKQSHNGCSHFARHVLATFKQYSRCMILSSP